MASQCSKIAAVPRLIGSSSASGVWSSRQFSTATSTALSRCSSSTVPGVDTSSKKENATLKLARALNLARALRDTVKTYGEQISTVGGASDRIAPLSNVIGNIAAAASPTPHLLNTTRTFASIPMPGSKKAVLTVSQPAAERVFELLETEPDALGIKVALRVRGCSGMSYAMDYVREPPKKFDEKIPIKSENGKEALVVVDSKAVLFLVGTVMDYVEVEMGSEFQFNNPNQKSECGCGQSFNV